MHCLNIGRDHIQLLIQIRLCKFTKITEACIIDQYIDRIITEALIQCKTVFLHRNIQYDDINGNGKLPL